MPTAPFVDVELSIERVVVFEDRARIQRKGKVKLDAAVGSTLKLRLPKVPALLVDNSVLARAEGAKVNDTRVTRRLVTLENHRPQATAEIERKLDQLNLDLAELDAMMTQKKALASGVAALAQRLLSEAAEDASFGTSVDAALGQELSELDGRTAKLEDEMFELEARRADVAEERDDVARQLRALSTPEQILQAELFVSVEVTATECELEVQYTVPCACWRPRHRFELLGGGNDQRSGTQRGEEAQQEGVPVKVESAATVWQNTGEDWANTVVALSTSRPSLGTTPPELATDTLRSKPKSETIEVSARQEKIHTTGLAKGGGGDVKPMPGIDDGGEVRLYESQQRHSIASNGRAHRVELGSFETSSKLDSVCFPELKQAVMLRSEQKNESNGPLLAGPCDLVRDKGLLGTASIDYVSARSRFELAWGVDPDLYVQRTKTSRTMDASMLGSWHTTRHAVKIQIRNLGPEAKAFEVTERIPVSEIEKIRIELLRDSTQPKQTADDNGFVRWKVTLEPFTDTELRLGYEVKRHSDVADFAL